MFDLRMIKTESSALIEARKSDLSYRRVHMIKVQQCIIVIKCPCFKFSKTLKLISRFKLS